jgi:hypothetical protein
MDKSTWETASQTECMSFNLGAAMSVLREAVEYFEKKLEPHGPETTYLVMWQAHILNLFYVAEKMLCDLEKEQKEIIDWLYGKAKEERRSQNEQ